MKRLLIITVLALMLLSGCNSTGESTETTMKETTTKETTSQPETDGTKEGNASDFVELQGDGSGSVTETYSNITFDVPDSWKKKEDLEKHEITYKTDAGLLMLKYSPIEGEYDKQTTEMFTSAMVLAIEDSDGYEELKKKHILISGNPCEVILYKDIKNGEEYLNCSAVFNDFESSVCFIYGQPMREDSSMAIPIVEIYEGIKIVDVPGGTNSEAPDNESATIDEKEVLSAKDSYGPGQYKVGTDIPAGEYFVSGSSVYFAVSTDSNGDDIIFNDFTEQNSIITIQDGEYLELKNCKATPFTGNENIDFNHGTYMVKVGTQLKAGEYKLTAMGERGYYCIYSDSRQDKILSNDFFEGSSYVTVTDGQYLQVQKCKIE